MTYIVQSLVFSNALVNATSNETSGIFHSTQLNQSSSIGSQTNSMQPLLDMIQQLKTELTEDRAEITNLSQ